MIFYPKSYFNKIVDIDVNFFIEKNIKAVLLDIDNTILDKRHNMVQGLEEWVKTLKENNIKNRFLKASIGWIKYKPLLLYIKDKENYKKAVTWLQEARRR